MILCAPSHVHEAGVGFACALSQFDNWVTILTQSLSEICDALPMSSALSHTALRLLFTCREFVAPVMGKGIARSRLRELADGAGATGWFTAEERRERAGLRGYQVEAGGALDDA